MADNSIHSSKLDGECSKFCTYLINQPPGKYVMEKYQEAHRSGKSPDTGSSAFDNLLVRIAKMNPFFTKLTDVYTSFFMKRAVFRKKLILLLAILESCPPSFNYVDSVIPSGKVMLFSGIAVRVLSYAFSLILSIIIFMPVHLTHLTFKIFAR